MTAWTFPQNEAQCDSPANENPQHHFVTKLVGSHQLLPIGNNSEDSVWWKRKWNFYLLIDIHNFDAYPHCPHCPHYQRSKQAAGGWPPQLFPAALHMGEGRGACPTATLLPGTCLPKSALLPPCSPLFTGLSLSTYSAPGQVQSAQGGARSLTFSSCTGAIADWPELAWAMGRQQPPWLLALEGACSLLAQAGSMDHW